MGIARVCVNYFILNKCIVNVVAQIIQFALKNKQHERSQKENKARIEQGGCGATGRSKFTSIAGRRCAMDYHWLGSVVVGMPVYDRMHQWSYLQFYGDAMWWQWNSMNVSLQSGFQFKAGLLNRIE
jgi:hypothetical protein